jgi:predicted RNase H-like HicB family nuclease
VKRLIVVEQTPSGFSAFSPDLPGCIATGATRAEVEREARRAVAFHLDGMRREGLKVPAPRSYATYVEVAA